MLPFAGEQLRQSETCIILLPSVTPNKFIKKKEHRSLTSEPTTLTSQYYQQSHEKMLGLLASRES